LGKHDRDEKVEASTPEVAEPMGNHALLQHIVDAIPAPIFYKDHQGVYRGGNRAFSEYLGLPLTRIVGSTVFDVAPHDLAVVYHEADLALMRSGGYQRYETQVKDAQGQVRDVLFTKATFDANGTSGLVGTMLDISDRKAAERLAEARANDAVRALAERRTFDARMALTDRLASVGTLAAGVAHEINNPLTYVATNIEFVSEVLAGDKPLTAELRAELALAMTEASGGVRRAVDIVKSLRTFARDAPPNVEPVLVDQVVRGAIHLAAAELRKSGDALVHIEDGCMALGDTVRISQVLLNLLMNAAHAVSGLPATERRLAIRARTEGTRVRIQVEDNGSGIPRHLLGRVFDPFFTTKAVGEGTGLGLALCHEVVTKLGGTIAIDSEEGKGTTVTVDLPAAT
jgi:PAS domain S-box-containing protein